MTEPTLANLYKIDAVAHELISERVRQIMEEGRAPAHDDDQDNGQLAKAAVSYAEVSTWRDEVRAMVIPFSWPWPTSWWKPKDRRRDLVRAGALIIAEIERLDRAASRTKTG
jgi:hypothetical protein